MAIIRTIWITHGHGNYDDGNYSYPCRKLTYPVCVSDEQ